MDSNFDPSLILFPIFPLIFLMHFHTVYNASLIQKSVANKELDFKWLKYMNGWEEIPNDIQSSRELYKNLFQAPLLFLIFCLCAFVVQHVTIINLTLAWLYVVLRIWHYCVRAINPKLSTRMRPFKYSVITSSLLWIDLLIFLLK